jgi:hypothetical protein
VSRKSDRKFYQLPPPIFSGNPPRRVKINKLSKNFNKTESNCTSPPIDPYYERPSGKEMPNDIYSLKKESDNFSTKFVVYALMSILALSSTLNLYTACIYGTVRLGSMNPRTSLQDKEIITNKLTNPSAFWKLVSLHIGILFVLSAFITYSVYRYFQTNNRD